MRGQVVGCAAEALHGRRHLESLCCVCKSRKVEGGVRFSWAQRNAQIQERYKGSAAGELSFEDHNGEG